MLELKTAAVCMVAEGAYPPSVVGELYRFLIETEIPHPRPQSQAAVQLWQEATRRATPDRCSKLLNR